MSTTLFWPTDADNDRIIHRARRGKRLPGGDVYFTPPLVLRDVSLVRGDVTGRTRLLPYPDTSVGPLVQLDTSTPGDYSHQIAYPLRCQIQDLRIQGTAWGQTGIRIDGGVMSLERVTLVGCMVGIEYIRAQNIVHRELLCVNCNTGLEILGASDTVLTTLRYEGCRFNHSNARAVNLGRGINILFKDNCIFEGNPGTALHVEPWPEGAEITCAVRDAYFESNGLNVFDPASKIVWEGLKAELG